MTWAQGEGTVHGQWLLGDRRVATAGAQEEGSVHKQRLMGDRRVATQGAQEEGSGQNMITTAQ